MRFSRVSLVAFGTAAAVAASSLTAPAFAEEQPASIIQVADENTAEETSSGSSDIDVDDVFEYVVLITGIISGISAGLTLATALDRAAR